MSTVHFWFRSGAYGLLGHLDSPPAHRRVGIVMVPPFGWEEVCCYRPLRLMARTFAEMGIPTLRYDLPATGDSSGDAQDPGLFEAWIQSVADAAAELRHAVGVDAVAAVGIHQGATLALASASRGSHLDQLVLWGAVSRGRTLVRELRAAANVERWEVLAEQDAPPQPLPGLESGGFLLSPETLASLENLDISRLPGARARRILLLSRDELAHDPRLVEHLRASAGNVELRAGHGYSAMTAQPQEAAFPLETSRSIAEFVGEDFPETADSRGTDFVAGHSSTTAHTAGGGASESTCRIEQSSAAMFGILAEPAPGLPRGEYGVLYLNAGGVRHIGPNRMWVESARRWAARGVASLRLDLHGIGESDGDEFLDIPALYRECLLDQIQSAVETLRRDSGLEKFVAIGLCSGACWAFHAVLRSREIRAAVLLNPSLLYWDPAVDRRRTVKSIAGGFTDWAGRIRSGFQRGDLQRGMRRVAERLRRRAGGPGTHLQLGHATVADAWIHLAKAKKRVALVFRDGEPLLGELEAAGQLPPENDRYTRCIRVPNGGHTFRPLWSQKLAHEVMDAEIAAATGAEDGWLMTEPLVNATRK